MEPIFSAGASLLGSSYHRSLPATPSSYRKRAIVSKRVRELADIPRAASLRDVRVEATVAHTKSKLRAQFFVEMTRGSTLPLQSWGFGVSLADVRRFESQMRRLVKQHCRMNRRAVRKGETPSCSMCVHLGEETRERALVSCWSTIGKRHMDEKRAMVGQFFEQLFVMLSSHAQWLHECKLLREILRMTEELCQMQYPHDGDAVDVIRRLRRVDMNDEEGATSCTICMEIIHQTPKGTAENGRT
ncbi:hypothetical protein BBJ28_00001289 [Nothophytophthora sp. Chile5]|nr:hypothetical protein BBJ28_00001289 [Nothophytophthora sp. Chile5]